MAIKTQLKTEKKSKDLVKIGNFDQKQKVTPKQSCSALCLGFFVPFYKRNRRYGLSG